MKPINCIFSLKQKHRRIDLITLFVRGSTLKLGTYYPCQRAVFTGRVRVSKNDTRIHGYWTPVFTCSGHGPWSRVILDSRVHGPWTRPVNTARGHG